MVASKHPRAFRLFRHDTKEMLYPEELEVLGMTLTPTGLPRFERELMNDSTLMWLSGEKDMDGIPLFEGDICEIGVVNEFGSSHKTIAIMRWREDDKRFMLSFELKSKEFTQHKTNFCKRIGNEFQNPELMEKLNGENL